MKEIKTKDTGKSLPTIDKTSELSSRMKQGLIRSKDYAQNLADDGQLTPEEYAEDKIKYASEDVAGEVAHDSKKTVKKTYDGGKRLVQQIKQKRQSGDTIKQTEKSTGKQTFKTMNKGIKTAGNSAKRTVKTSEAAAHKAIKTTKKTAKTAEKTVKAAKKSSEAAAKAAKKSAEAARKTAEATAKAAKVAVKAMIAAVKAIARGIKSLVSAIIAGGWVSVVIIIVITLFGLILGTCYGIFCTGEEIENTYTLQDAVSEISMEYDYSITEILEDNEYDVVEMSGDRAEWSEVLAVYAVKVSGDPENPQEVVTMDANKSDILRTVFWDMNHIEYRTEVEEKIIREETEDGQGNIVVSEIVVERIRLVIEESHKTPEEMADEYGFNNDQKQQLAELTDPKNAEMWENLLYGYSTGNEEIVDVAKSQFGNEGGKTYWTWYGFNSRVEWCAIFVSWCANECGYIDDGVIPMFADPEYAVAWFRERGLWNDRNYVPNPGDIIFFDWDYNGYTDTADHVGIVERVDGEKVYTIEGNSGDAVHERTYTIGERDILGYATPQY